MREIGSTRPNSSGGRISPDGGGVRPQNRSADGSWLAPVIALEDGRCNVLACGDSGSGNPNGSQRSVDGGSGGPVVSRMSGWE